MISKSSHRSSVQQLFLLQNSSPDLTGVFAAWLWLWRRGTPRAFLHCGPTARRGSRRVHLWPQSCTLHSQPRVVAVLCALSAPRCLPEHANNSSIHICMARGALGDGHRRAGFCWFLKHSRIPTAETAHECGGMAGWTSMRSLTTCA